MVEDNAITFRLNRASGMPVYMQLVDQVREGLRMGVLRAGDRLPTVREAVASSGVNPNTVLKAYRELATAGLIEARPGSGTFISGSLGSVDPAVMARLHGQLQRWVQRARDAGLEEEDLRALIGSVLGRSGDHRSDVIA